VPIFVFYHVAGFRYKNVYGSLTKILYVYWGWSCEAVCRASSNLYGIGVGVKVKLVRFYRFFEQPSGDKKVGSPPVAR
jgi:hypothetical protein